ncbi:HAD hydrolase family protein, partial [Corynebacterium bovis]
GGGGPAGGPAGGEPGAVEPRHVVAFGDMANDLEMIAWAGHGVAMGNAIPALKDAADEVTASNDDDGVARVLERWF